MTNQGAKEYTFRALTDLWTGDADGKPGRTITTGLLGSIRWWFEVLVRGLGGGACDPTSSRNRCPDSQKKATDSGHHCVACELFGCTGWARKFRFEVLDENGKAKAEQITRGQTFKLRFTPLRPILPQEWALLDLTLRLIADYGAIGGKTVYKPSDEPGLADLDMSNFQEKQGQVTVRQSRKGLPLQKNDLVLKIGDTSITSMKDMHDACSGKLHGEEVRIEIMRGGSAQTIQAWFGKRHHIAYGLIQVVVSPAKPPGGDPQQLTGYVKQERWLKPEHGDLAWASLKNFWCVKGRYLARQNQNTSNFNKVIGRKEPKVQSQQLAANGDVNRWLAGTQQQSKKVFSFKEPECARRTFGFLKPGVVWFDDMKARLKQAWPDLEDTEFLRGHQILEGLFS